MSVSSFSKCVLLACLIAGPAPRADTLPPKDSGAAFGSNHEIGFSDGVLYLHTGDSLYVVDAGDPSGPSFNLHMSGLRSAFGGTARALEGSFSTASGGQAMINAGFSDGGVLTVDLMSRTSRSVTDFDDDNIFRTAGRNDRTFYAMWADTVFPPSTSTLVYRIDPADLTTQPVVDPALGTGDASGGMVFDRDDNLIIGTFDFIRDRARFFRVEATDLSQFESGGVVPPVAELGSARANGNRNLVVDREGRIFFNTTTGIGLFDPSTGDSKNFYRDVCDPDLFNYDGFKLPLNGLAYAAGQHQLVFAEFDTELDGYELIFLDVPEPLTAVMLVLGTLAFASQRHAAGGP